MKNIKNRLKAAPWLLKSNPWTKYRTLVDLLELPHSSRQVKDAKDELLKDKRINMLLADAFNWMEVAPTRYSDPKLSYYKLRMLSDFGFNINDMGSLNNIKIKDVVEKAAKHIEDDMFSVRGVLPERPKKGEKFIKPDPHTDEWHASPCNSPVITYTLLKLGLDNSLVKRAVTKLKDRWDTEQGWFCHFFFVDSQFKKLNIGCPMAGLMALEVFSLVPELKESEYAINAFKTLKSHREYGKSIYYFGRSKKFWTFKYPFVWYNALYMAEVLSRFKFLKNDALLNELIKWIEDSQDKEGRFRPTSMFMTYKGWDFADKSQASPWITFLCCRILKRRYG